MKLKPIITSLLSQDYYKFTMGQWIFHKHNGIRTHWEFKCRDKEVHFTEEMINEIKEQIKHYCTLRFSQDELDFLLKNIYLHDDYVNGFLFFWHPRENEIKIGSNSQCGLTIDIDGSENNVQYYETQIMAIVCEVYYRMGGANISYETLLNNYKNVQVKEIIEGFKSEKYKLGVWSDFGFRRRLSGEAQDYFISEIVKNNITSFIGTSNVYLAKKYNVKPIGSVAHQAILLCQGNTLYNPAYCNKLYLDSWFEEYGQLPGIALGDTIGTDIFLKDFKRTYSHIFDGVRHDSGDPYEWGEKIINHYKRPDINVDPKTKTLLFSDGLTFQKATELYNYFKDRTKVAFGIGGSCCSPYGNELNIVIKPVKVNNQDVAKLSDQPGKCMCKNPEYIDYLKRCINWRMKHE